MASSVLWLLSTSSLIPDVTCGSQLCNAQSSTSMVSGTARAEPASKDLFSPPCARYLDHCHVPKTQDLRLGEKRLPVAARLRELPRHQYTLVTSCETYLPISTRGRSKQRSSIPTNLMRISVQNAFVATRRCTYLVPDSFMYGQQI